MQQAPLVAGASKLSPSHVPPLHSPIPCKAAPKLKPSRQTALPAAPSMDDKTDLTGQQFDGLSEEERNQLRIERFGVLSRDCSRSRHNGGRVFDRVPRWCAAKAVRLVTVGVRFDKSWERAVAMADKMIDVRMFKDPYAKNLVDHDGYYPEIITRFTRHPAFKWWISSARAELAVGRCLVLYCHSGRHRSVAGALILRNISNRMGLRCGEIDHLVLKKCPCPECGGQGPAFAAALSEACRVAEG